MRLDIAIKLQNKNAGLGLFSPFARLDQGFFFRLARLLQLLSLDFIEHFEVQGVRQVAEAVADIADFEVVGRLLLGRANQREYVRGNE